MPGRRLAVVLGQCGPRQACLSWARDMAGIAPEHGSIPPSLPHCPHLHGLSTVERRSSTAGRQQPRRLGDVHPPLLVLHRWWEPGARWTGPSEDEVPSKLAVLGPRFNAAPSRSWSPAAGTRSLLFTGSADAR